MEEDKVSEKITRNVTVSHCVILTCIIHDTTKKKRKQKFWDNLLFFSFKAIRWFY